MKRVVALGFFDGVHLGHGALLRRTAEKAEELGCRACAMTYDLPPRTVVTGRPVPLLCGQSDRAELMSRLYGVKEVIFEHFDERFMHMPWRDFVTDILSRDLEAVHVVAGHDFTFGYGGEGNASRLSELCGGLGIGCDIIPAQTLDGIVISSTYIRGLIAEGDVERAARFLGHNYRLSGRVAHGRGLGRSLGFPTANIPVPHDRQAPAWGVYFTKVTACGGVFPAVTNIGLRPTVGHGGAPLVESSLIDAELDLYGREIHVDFFRFARAEKRFESLDALRAGIAGDFENARAFFY